jgi:hypothetical protein
MRRHPPLLSVRGCLEARDLWLWERELSPSVRTCVPLVMALLVAAICLLVALLGIAALAIVPFVILTGAAVMICRLIRS